jgi:HEPN domain-containing protein
MLREAAGPDDPAEWLRRARSSLERARADARLPGVYLEDLCFDAQQAAERAIKAVFVGRATAFPYVQTWSHCSRCFSRTGWRFPTR